MNPFFFAIEKLTGKKFLVENKSIVIIDMAEIWKKFTTWLKFFFWKKFSIHSDDNCIWVDDDDGDNDFMILICLVGGWVGWG